MEQLNKFYFALLLGFLVLLLSVNILFAQTDVNNFPVYAGNDLGVDYKKEATKFRIWAPTATQVTLRIYENGEGGNAIHTTEMKKDVEGTWFLQLSGDWKNKFYTFQAKIGDALKNEVPDTYARAVGVNGKRGMIIDLAETNPENWEADKKPELKSVNDIVIWEIHTRDFSVHPSSGIKNKGKFLAFTEKGTKTPQGEKTGLDHLVDLGITHIHLLPAFDFSSVDESKPEQNKYNWGYDPQNYNTPEGSYSTNPYDGKVRIREFKEMVKALHENGIRIIMDMVYNHVSNAGNSNFDQLVPGYFFRHNKDGSLSNGSFCGNETASDQPMMQKFMIESVTYWAKEYHIDGFRFDLMGLHDIETMTKIRDAVNQIDTSIYMYGEGWVATSPLPESKQATKYNVSKLNGIGVFSDDIRDGIRGSWSDMHAPGFMCGNETAKESIKFGIVASGKHPQIDYSKVNYAKDAYSINPSTTITYVTCHDNPCLWDKISATCKTTSAEQKIMTQKLANAIVLTSQGIPLLHAGEEVVRTKHGVENSFESPDSINWIDWTRKAEFKEVYTYYKSLIELRKKHPAFRMPTTKMISENIHFFDFAQALLVGYQINGKACGDTFNTILVYFNSAEKDETIELPKGKWKIIANGKEINEKGLQSGLKHSTTISAKSMLILIN